MSRGGGDGVDDPPCKKIELSFLTDPKCEKRHPPQPKAVGCFSA